MSIDLQRVALLERTIGRVGHNRLRHSSRSLCRFGVTDFVTKGWAGVRQNFYPAIISCATIYIYV